MDIFNLFKQKKDTETRSVVNCSCSPCCYSDGLSFFPFINREGSMSLSVVYRCIDLISDAISILPIEVKKVDEPHGKSENNHPVSLLFKDDKNTIIPIITVMKMIVRDVLVKGNSYVYIERSNDGTPIRLRYLENKDVQLIYDKIKYSIRYQVPLLMKGKLIEPKDMLHFKKYTFNGVEGVGIMTYAKRSIDIANQTENAAQQYFANGGLLSGIITVNSNLSEQQRKQIRESWQNTYGTGGSGGVAVLQGNMSYQQLSSNASDSQMLETRNYAVKDIARFFGINPMLIGEIDNLQASALNALNQEFLTHTLQPYINMIESELNRKLMSDNNFYINLDETAILKTDKLTTSQYYNSMISSGVLCINETRKELGYAPIEGGDKHFVAFTDVEQNTINKSKSKKIKTNDKEG